MVFLEWELFAYMSVPQANCFLPIKHAQWEWKIGKKY